MSEDQCGGVMVQRTVDDDAGVDSGSVDGPMEQLLGGNDPVLVVEKQAEEDLAVVVTQPAAQVVAGQQ